MEKKYIMNTYGRFDVTLTHGRGAKVYDGQGREFIDFVSGVAVNCLGHSHPVIVKTLIEQSQQLIHISNLYWNNKQMALAEKLVLHSDHDQVFFCNSGTEAVEGALKLARKYGGSRGNQNKKRILYMENSFHGRTLGALAVTGQEKYQKPFLPLMEEVQSVKFNDIEDFKKKMNEEVCGVILEPIQGEGGIISAERDFLETIREYCDQYDALLIFDEVQCGIGRTGALYAYQSFGVVPDVVCMAKGLGGGFPIGAILAKAKAAEAFVPGDHGCTFGGNPLACAVALAVLEELLEGEIIEQVKQRNTYLVQGLQHLKEQFGVIEKIQGMGLLLGIHVRGSGKTIIDACFKKGLLLVGAGEHVVRILPPLNIEKEEMDKGLEILEEVLAALPKMV